MSWNVSKLFGHSLLKVTYQKNLKWFKPGMGIRATRQIFFIPNRTGPILTELECPVGIAHPFFELKIFREFVRK